MRLRLLIFLFSIALFIAYPAWTQSPNGTISGLVVDSSGAAIVNAEILVGNYATGVQYNSRTNEQGLYLIPNLPPGTYRLQVSKVGFKTLIKPDITLNVQDALAINFTLPLGAVSEVVTITAGAPLVNTRDAAVSTVIDRNFVENLPLNGRSFNTLLQLTPGVVIAPALGQSYGQFSVAGQRTDANNFLIDGVSANFGVAPTVGLGASGFGQSQAFSALGGTSSLISVEALQEFRVETSSFAPEFGRSPGGQVILTTRSGTNDFHGGIYEYFRNNVMDANDWFANAAGKPTAPERHNDFGGFLGGPIFRDRTFFFLSYEGARLRLPQTVVFQVPSTQARASASSAIAPFLDAYPLPDPNGPVSPSGYTSRFTAVYSNGASLNAGSVRIDHSFNSRFAIFGRYSDAPSETINRNGLSQLGTTTVDTKTLTLAAVLALSQKVTNDLRANYSAQNSRLAFQLDSFGGAIPPASSVLFGSLSPTENLAAFGTFDTGLYSVGPDARNKSAQVNIADDLSFSQGKHRLKFGGDYRAIYFNETPFSHELLYLATSVQSIVSTGTVNLSSQSTNPARLLARALSIYGQDTWRVNPRLALSYGLRWEVSPAPSARGNTQLASWTNVNNLATIALAPQGTAVWKTTYGDVSPRFGLAYDLSKNGDFVLRVGGGIFYDLGLGEAGQLASGFPNSASSFHAGVALPLSNVASYLPALSLQPPYPNGIFAFSPDLRLPQSYQWNLAIEKSFGGSHQAISATYAGQAGRDLLREEALFRPNPSFAGLFQLTQNAAFSNYHALQLQYRRPLSAGLQALVNYSWSHSLDNASSDTVLGLSNTVISAENDYASSDFDVRHSFSAALTYAIPRTFRTPPLSLITEDWSLDGVVVARSGFPFNALVSQPSLSGGFVDTRPDLVPGQPFWIANPNVPGGQSLNPNAFSLPPAPRQGTEGRNDIPGFGLTEMDLSLGRKFSLTERLRLQFRADAFNLFNHPNFYNPPALIELGPAYLVSTRMLNQGLGGLNPLFQEGGPRSLQLSLKLTF